MRTCMHWWSLFCGTIILVILCRVLVTIWVVGTARSRGSYFLLLKHRIILAIEVLIGKYGMVWEARQNHFLLFPEILEWASKTMNCHELRILNLLLWCLWMELMALAFVVKVMYVRLGDSRTVELVGICHHTWGDVWLILNRASSGPPPAPSSQVLSRWYSITCYDTT